MIRIPKNREGYFIDMTSLVDILFLLIIFFLIATTFQNYKKIAVNLPQSETGDKTKQDSLVISIDKSGSVVIDGKAFTPKQLDDFLRGGKERYAGKTVFLDGDRDVPYDTVIRVMDILRRNGYVKISLGVYEY